MIFVNELSRSKSVHPEVSKGVHEFVDQSVQLLAAEEEKSFG